MREIDTFKVLQSSLQFGDPDRVKSRDYHAIYTRAAQKGVHVIGHTEAGEAHDILKPIARDHGYRLFQPSVSQGGRVANPISVHNSVNVVDANYIHLVPAEGGAPSEGGHGPRGLMTVVIQFAGGDLAVSEWHALTGWGYGDAKRQATILRQWNAVCRIAAGYGAASDVSVLIGDVNYDPDDHSPNTPDKILKKYGWTSIFDELGREDLGTHHRRTIDQGYTLDKDRRVEAKSVKVLTNDGMGKDHNDVLFALDIKRRS